jgi:hypothetical protein
MLKRPNHTCGDYFNPYKTHCNLHTVLRVGLLLPDVVCFGKFGWFAGSLVSSLSVGLLLEVFLFGLMRGCFPKLFVVYYALHEGCSCFGSSVARCGSLVPVLLVVGCFAGSMYRGSLFSAWLVLGSMFHGTRLCVLLWSRESVPLASVYSVLLVSSLYRKLVLLFLIYILLTFDQKK